MIAPHEHARETRLLEACRHLGAMPDDIEVSWSYCGGHRRYRAELALLEVEGFGSTAIEALNELVENLEAHPRFAQFTPGPRR
jgi:hypothetical protein